MSHDPPTCPECHTSKTRHVASRRYLGRVWLVCFNPSCRWYGYPPVSHFEGTEYEPTVAWEPEGWDSETSQEPRALVT